ncbi:lysophospholipid acyltransferase superfamily protein [Syntrophotalea carbinolica DSM 2380]|uniref:Lysophospholipid acyltransferase superfamily protein n=1 Tax=Syntrophotalea carbinolica (strain DSM 2380 / NBRC 103641 / GraBd1) TaxID=338963 RepID=Q3A0L3_SYNC1|nr:lysophospholipid acyltransferase superfamily protein [Syntrophotalea carbinolica]ABA90094.1 lysophospholipid acyltransferase superfamily protein [Syntrophotalea carbinolica DSM 2380]
MSSMHSEPGSRRARVLGAIGAWLLRLWCLSWRKRFAGVEYLDECIAGGQPTLVLFWHGSYVPLFALLRGRPACILTNSSLRGQVIAQISRRFGYATLELPDEHGRRFLAALRKARHEHVAWGTAADGPLGPGGRIKPPLITLAAHFGFSVQLVGVAARRAWRLNRRWDRMLLPLPFTRVGLVIGEPIQLPKGLDKAMAARQAKVLEASMARCALQAQDLLR